MKRNLLENYRTIMQEIEILHEEKEAFYGISASVIRENRGGSSVYDLSKIVAGVEAVEIKMMVRLEGLIKLREEIEDFIAGLPVLQGSICRLKYIEGKTFDEIGYMMNYSERQIYRFWKMIPITED